jgi:hypothetical protein
MKAKTNLKEWVCWQCGKFVKSKDRPSPTINECGHVCRFFLWLGKGTPHLIDPIDFEQYLEEEAEIEEI